MSFQVDCDHSEVRKLSAVFIMVYFTETKELDASSLTDKYVTHLFEFGKQLIGFSVAEHLLPKLKESHHQKIRELLFSGYAFAAFEPIKNQITGIKRSELIRMSDMNELKGFPDPLSTLLVFRVRHARSATQSLPAQIAKREMTENLEPVQKMGMPRPNRPIFQVNVFTIISRAKAKVLAQTKPEVQPLGKKAEEEKQSRRSSILLQDVESMPNDSKNPMLMPSGHLKTENKLEAPPSRSMVISSLANLDQQPIKTATEIQKLEPHEIPRSREILESPENHLLETIQNKFVENNKEEADIDEFKKAINMIKEGETYRKKRDPRSTMVRVKAALSLIVKKGNSKTSLAELPDFTEKNNLKFRVSSQRSPPHSQNTSHRSVLGTGKLRLIRDQMVSLRAPEGDAEHLLDGQKEKKNRFTSFDHGNLSFEHLANHAFEEWKANYLNELKKDKNARFFNKRVKFARKRIANTTLNPSNSPKRPRMKYEFEALVAKIKPKEVKEDQKPQSQAVRRIHRVHRGTKISIHPNKSQLDISVTSPKSQLKLQRLDSSPRILSPRNPSPRHHSPRRDQIRRSSSKLDFEQENPFQAHFADLITPMLPPNRKKNKPYFIDQDPMIKEPLTPFESGGSILIKRKKSDHNSLRLALFSITPENSHHL